jgi:hypothetical protein
LIHLDGRHFANSCYFCCHGNMVLNERYIDTGVLGTYFVILMLPQGRTELKIITRH